MEELSGKTDLKMRIAGIDTPEIKQTCEIEEDQSIDCGVLSKDYLQKLLDSEPGDLVIQPVGVDFYHRILIRLFKGETDIGKKWLKMECRILMTTPISLKRLMLKNIS